MLVDVTVGVSATHAVAGVVPSSVGHQARSVGLDGRRVPIPRDLSHDLQLSDEEINALIESGVIALVPLSNNDEH